MLLLCVMLLLAGCAQGEKQNETKVEKTSAVGFYFDTVVTLSFYGADETLAHDVWEACDRYEKMLSKTIEESDVWRINHAKGEKVTVDPETYAILTEAKEISEKSGGAFSMTLAPIIAMWDFTGGSERMPTEEARLAALPLVDDTKIALLGDNTVQLPDGMMIDLGGIAKGYIADKVAEIVRGRCVGAAINLGGNTYVVGSKPDGSLWRVGIQDPESKTGTTLAILSLKEGTVVTSGTYERYFEKDSVRYHHILSPETGLPANTGLCAATIVTESSMRADALATACIVLGREKALRLLEDMNVDGLLVAYDGTTWQAGDLAQRYQLEWKK